MTAAGMFIQQVLRRLSMSPASQTDWLIVLESFIGRVDGVDRQFREAELIRPSDPAVKKWPDKFGPAFDLHDLRHDQEAGRILSHAAREVRRPTRRGP